MKIYKILIYKIIFFMIDKNSSRIAPSYHNNFILAFGSDNIQSNENNFQKSHQIDQTDIHSDLYDYFFNDESYEENAIYGLSFNFSSNLIDLTLNSKISDLQTKEKVKTIEPFPKCFPVERLTSESSTKYSKKKVDLSRNANKFKLLFYQIFTTKKRFPKELVRKIHNIISDFCHLQKMTREEFRSIDLYFRNYSKYSEYILNFLQLHRKEIMRLVPELLNLI